MATMVREVGFQLATAAGAEDLDAMFLQRVAESGKEGVSVWELIAWALREHGVPPWGGNGALERLSRLEGCVAIGAPYRMRVSNQGVRIFDPTVTITAAGLRRLEDEGPSPG